MPNRVSGDLAAALGKSINRLCPQRFHAANENHCAHFICHMGGYQFGYRCDQMDGATSANGRGYCVRVQEVFPQCPEVGLWSDLPETEDDLLVFITSRNNVNFAAKTIRNVPQKHIGILRDGMVYHYSNGTDEVVRQSPGVVRDRFRATYDDQTVDLFFGTLPAGTRGLATRGAGASRGAKKTRTPAAPKSQALSLHIGLNEFDPAHYGEPGTLAGCENDARDMAKLAKREGFTAITPPLLTKKATAANVVGAIKKAAAALNAGDTFFITYAGHGAQVPDTNGDERDKEDETWCLYDRMLIDDELATLWATFREGVRVVMLSDSCHSGSVSRARRASAVEQPKRGQRYRLLPVPKARAVYRAHKGIYDAIQLGTKPRENVIIRASVLLISGCEDHQLSSDGDLNGLFTETLKAIWNNGAFTGTYKSLRDEVRALMPRDQKPRYSLEGSANPTLERERPFSSVAGTLPTPSAGKKAKPTPQLPATLSAILDLLKKFGLERASTKSSLRAWAKQVEKQDAKLGLPASRVDAFLTECFEQFGSLPLEKDDLLSGKVSTPGAFADLLPEKPSKPTRRTRGPHAPTAPAPGGALVTANLTKEQFLSQNKTALAAITDGVNATLRTRYGASASLITRHDLCVVFYCEAGLKSNGKVDADHTHSLGERGLLPLPSRIRDWNGNDAPAWNQPMSADTNVKHFFLYMGHLKNKDSTGAPRHFYRDLFSIPGIGGSAVIGAKVLAGVIHGYFYRGNYSNGQVPYDHLVQSYLDDELLTEFMRHTGYVHAGTQVLVGRERNIDTGLGLV